MKCPNGCNAEMEQQAGTNKHTCPECEKTFIITESGKIKPAEKGRIRELEENVAQTQQIVREMSERVLGKNETDDLFGCE